MNARYWTYTATGALVKLTLRPGQEMRHTESYPTDEGFHFEARHYKYDFLEGTEIMAVQEIVYTKDSDCDGPLEQYREFWATNLRADRVHPCIGWKYGRATCPDTGTRLTTSFPVYDESIHMPYWNAGTSWQKDHFAERAGY